MAESITESAYLYPALIGLLGVVIGAIISGLSNWFLIKREAKIRIQENLFMRRIKAYEEVIGFSRLLNTVVQTDEVDENGYAITYPGFLQDQEHFDNLILEFYQINNPLTYLLDVHTKKELRYIQDYLGTLNKFLKKKDEKDYIELAKKLRPDFRELAKKLESAANDFFDQEISSMNLRPQKGYPKISDKEFSTRIKNTKLYEYIK